MKNIIIVCLLSFCSFFANAAKNTLYELNVGDYSFRNTPFQTGYYYKSEFEQMLFDYLGTIHSIGNRRYKITRYEYATDSIGARLDYTFFGNMETTHNVFPEHEYRAANLYIEEVNCIDGEITTLEFAKADSVIKIACRNHCVYKLRLDNDGLGLFNIQGTSGSNMRPYGLFTGTGESCKVEEGNYGTRLSTSDNEPVNHPKPPNPDGSEGGVIDPDPDPNPDPDNPNTPNTKDYTNSLNAIKSKLSSVGLDSVTRGFFKKEFNTLVAAVKDNATGDGSGGGIGSSDDVKNIKTNVNAVKGMMQGLMANIQFNSSHQVTAINQNNADIRQQIRESSDAVIEANQGYMNDVIESVDKVRKGMNQLGTLALEGGYQAHRDSTAVKSEISKLGDTITDGIAGLSEDIKGLAGDGTGGTGTGGEGTDLSGVLDALAVTGEHSPTGLIDFGDTAANGSGFFVGAELLAKEEAEIEELKTEYQELTNSMKDIFNFSADLNNGQAANHSINLNIGGRSVNQESAVFSALGDNSGMISSVILIMATFLGVMIIARS